jgi:hypothetical protein
MNFWSCQCRNCSAEILLLRIEPERYTMSTLKPKFGRGRKVLQCGNCNSSHEYRRYEVREINFPGPLASLLSTESVYCDVKIEWGCVT